MSKLERKENFLNLSYLQQSNIIHNEHFLPEVGNTPGDSLTLFLSNTDWKFQAMQ